MMRRWIAALAAVAAASLALTACQAIPTSGPVHEGLTDFSPDAPSLQYDPGGPQAGASREEIVRGFVRAASSPIDDYRVARQFLAPSFATEWDASSGVFIEEGGQSVSTGEDGEVTLSLTGLAELDEFGTMQLLPSGAPTEARFELELVGGEWRITSAPAGVILDRRTFTELWSQRQLYFLTRDGRLIGESRWYLNRSPLSTQLVNGLLNGPSEGMVGAISTAFPAGTSLSLNSVPVTDGQAQIDLSEELLAADAATLELIKRQLAATLQSDSRVSSFEISVGGVAVEHGMVGGAIESPNPAERTGAVIVSGGKLGLVTVDGVQSLPEIGDRIVALDPTAIGLSFDYETAAVRTAEGVSWVSSDAIVQVDARPGQLEPSVDRFGYVWSYASSMPERVLVTRPGVSQDLLSLPSLEGRSPVAVHVSKSGVRLAVLVSDGEQSEVLVVGIVRDVTGKPIGFSEEAVPQLWVAGAPLDLDWIDDQRFAVLSRANGAGRVTVGSSGGFPDDRGTVIDAVALISTSGGTSGLRVLSGEGRLYARQGVGWQRQIENVELAAKSG